jgi:N-acetylated-alpha-linked acidic dipeptidase
MNIQQIHQSHQILSHTHQGKLNFNCSGFVSGDLFYLNYGRVEDFKRIKDLGIDLRGSIVLIRYGKIYRGLKVQNAENAGAKGVILYSDPIDDGDKAGVVYPNGPYRPESSVQRGSLEYLSTYPGDPTTPGFASLPGTTQRLNRDEVTNIPKICVHPISYRDAKQFLNILDGEDADGDWQGGITLDNNKKYKIGISGSIYKTSINIDQLEEIKPIFNVFLTIEGIQKNKKR